MSFTGEDSDHSLMQSAYLLPFSNVHSHPGDHDYQCIRLTGTQFASHVWRFPDAQLFLLQSGWIEVRRYIVT